MRDLHNNVGIQQTIAPAVLTADTNGAAVDKQGFDAIEHVVNIGVPGIALSGTNRIDLKIEESDDGTAFTAVTDKNRVLGPAPDANGVFVVLDASAKGSQPYKIGYIGNKRYSRVVADFSGTHGTGTPIGAVAIKGAPAIAPVA